MKQNDYYSSIHRLGRWSTLIGIALMFMVPFASTIIYQVKLDVASIMAAAAQLCIVFIPTQLTEVISFSPILGAGGTYLSFITGNVINMKLPAATAGHRLMNVEPHSEEGEVVSVLAIGMSSITTTLIIFAGMFIFAPFIHYLDNPVLKPGFSSVMPALLGIMLLPHLRKSFPLAVAPLIISTVFGILLGGKYGNFQGYLLLITMILSVAASVIITNAKNK